MRPVVRVTGDVSGVLEALTRAQEARSLVIEAGFPGKSRSEKHQGDGQNPPSVLQVAAWNEFGTQTAPARPFMRQTLPRHARALRAELGERIGEWLRGGGNAQALDGVGRAMGVKLRGAIQETITHGDYKDNADLTKMIKGSKPRKTFFEAVAALRGGEPVPGGTRPLLDRGQMRQAVRWQVKRRGKITDRGGPT